MNLQEKRNDMITKEFDTIAAISTPLLVGGDRDRPLERDRQLAIAQKSSKVKIWPAWLVPRSTTAIS